MHQQIIHIRTASRQASDVTEQIADVVANSGVTTGLAHIFIAHTSASLMICENADPDVQRDLETFFSGLVNDGDPAFRHRCEGPDDMPAHIRSVLTHTDVTVPIAASRLILGTWQGIYIWEHRYRGYERRLVVTVNGAP